jgi:O-antigen ligase
MKYLRIIILFLILCNIPSFLLKNFNATAGTVLSYLTFLLIIVYYFFYKIEKPLNRFIILGLLYFFISVFVDSQGANNVIVTFIKYFIFIIAGATAIKDAKVIEIYFILLFGSLSIIYESIFIIDIGGRFSGFYLNPNSAGFICILGYCLSFSIDNIKLRLLGQFLFSIAGFVTFSRTFLLLWVLINIISISISYKNASKFLVGIIIFSLLLSFGDKFDFNTRRLEAFSNILDGVVSDEMEEDSRIETWAMYYDRILDSPIFGNGYLSFSGKTIGSGNSSYSIVGVHNTYLMILGEAGFLVFIFFVWIYVILLIRGYRLFRNDPMIFLVNFSVIMYMLTSHNYFDNYLLLFVSIWLYLKIDKKNNILRKNLR